MKYIQYIGRKSRKVDNVNSRSDRIWDGFGSTLEVPEDQAKGLLAFKDIWREVESLDAEAPENPYIEDKLPAADLKKLVERRTGSRLAQVIRAIPKVVAAGEVSKDGKPKVHAIAKNVDFEVTAELRDAAVGAIEAARAMDLQKELQKQSEKAA